MVRIYMDVHVPGPITAGLRRRGVEVITAQEDGRRRLLDRELLDRAGALGAVIFTRDEDFLAEAAARLRCGETFTAILYAHQRGPTIRQCIRDLEIFAHAASPEELRNCVHHLPL